MWHCYSKSSFCFKENAALFFVVGIIRNINTLCGQSAELLVLKQVVRIITTVRGKCAKACDCEGSLFFFGGGGGVRVGIGCKGFRVGTSDVPCINEYGN
jgi:hypothetical protein